MPGYGAYVSPLNFELNQLCVEWSCAYIVSGRMGFSCCCCCCWDCFHVHHTQHRGLVSAKNGIEHSVTLFYLKQWSLHYALCRYNTHTHTHGRVYDNWILNIHFLKPITRGIHCIPIEPQNRFACQINIIVDNRGCCFCCGVVVVAFVVDSMLYAGRYDTLIRIDCCRYWFYTLPVCAVVDLAILQKKRRLNIGSFRYLFLSSSSFFLSLPLSPSFSVIRV